MFNFAPNVDFRYRFSKVSQLRFTYRGRASQPSMENLLDVTDDSNPLNIRKGNPGLKPSSLILCVCFIILIMQINSVA